MPQRMKKIPDILPGEILKVSKALPDYNCGV